MVSSHEKDEVMQSHRRAWNMKKDGDLDGALQEIERVLQLRPENTLLWTNKGAFLRDMDRLDEAEQALVRALEQDKRNFFAWTELSQVYESKELFEKAAFCLEQSVEIKPNFTTYTMLANVQLAFNSESALRNANKALKLNPKWEEAERVKRRAQQYMREGRG